MKWNNLIYFLLGSFTSAAFYNESCCGFLLYSVLILFIIGLYEYLYKDYNSCTYKIDTFIESNNLTLDLSKYSLKELSDSYKDKFKVITFDINKECGYYYILYEGNYYYLYFRYYTRFIELNKVINEEVLKQLENAKSN